jgi:selenocysteine lyase/cysteine desulfurase
MNMKEIRSLFPGAEAQIYFDVGVRGLLSTPVREAVDRYLEARMMGTGDKAELIGFAEGARESFAALINADCSEVALTKNVSEGLNLFAASLPWEAGDNVIVCPELEHPNNVFLWYNLERLHGIEVRTLEPDGGRVPTDRMVSAMDARTRLITVPHITFAPGFITDLEPLRRSVREHSALLLVDAAQSVGAIDIDVRALGIDALAVATQKCLLGFYGFGFLWVRRSLADTLKPGHVARYGIDLGEGAHETAIGSGELRFQPGALRFDLGNFNYLGAAAAQASIELLRSIRMKRVETHLRSLAARLATGLLELGLPVPGGAPGEHLAHIVSVGESGGGRHYTADDPKMNELYDQLTRNGVRLSIRRGVLRMSLGIYNDEADVDRVVALTREWVNESRQGGP